MSLNREIYFSDGLHRLVQHYSCCLVPMGWDRVLTTLPFSLWCFWEDLGCWTYTRVPCFGVVLRCCTTGKIIVPCVFGVSSSEKRKNKMKRSGCVSVASCKIKTLNKWNHCCSSNCWWWLIWVFLLGMGEVYLLGLLKSSCSSWVTGSSLPFVSAPFWMHLHRSPHVFFSSCKEAPW